MALYARFLEHGGIFRGLATNLLDRLLDLELHVWAMVGDTAQFAEIAFRARAALHTLVRAALHTLATEVVLIGDCLGEVDRGQIGRDIDRRRDDLEPLRRRRSHFLGQSGQIHLGRRRFWLGGLLWR